MSEAQKFDIIYADFPWQYVVYSNETGSGRSAAKHYTTRKSSTFYDLPMLRLLNKNALVMLWATKPNLMEVDPLVQAWNQQAKHKHDRLKYKTGIFTWAKLNKGWKATARKLLKDGLTDGALDELAIRMFANGNGFYTMANTELVLLYGRGSLNGNLERLSRSVRDFQAHLKGRHSEKPDAFNELISAIFPRARCLEMFARRHYPDPRWTCIGKELSGMDIHDDIEILLGNKEDPKLSGIALI